MTTNIYILDWAEPTRTFGTDFNGQVADLDDERIAIIDYSLDSRSSSLVIIDQSPTGSAASSTDTQDWPVLDREFGRENWQAFLRDHEQESRDMFNADELAELEAEHDHPLTDEQKEKILAIADEGWGIDTAIARVIEVEATVQIDAGQEPITDENGDYTGEQRHFDFVTFTTTDGEQLEKTILSGGIEQGVYVESCEDPEPYDIAAEQWLEGIPGIWVVGTWN